MLLGNRLAASAKRPRLIRGPSLLLFLYSAVGVDLLQWCDGGCPDSRIILGDDSHSVGYYVQCAMLAPFRARKETGSG